MPVLKRDNGAEIKYVLKSVDNALMILDVLADARNEMSLSDIARALSISKSATFRLMDTLIYRGFIQQDPSSKKYRLGPHLIFLGTATIGHNEPLKVIHRHLEKLAKEINENAHYVVFDGREIIFLDKVESSRPAKMGSWIGAKMPAYCTGTGKALLASLPDDRLGEYLDSATFRRYTEFTITDRTALLSELKNIRKCGYSVDNQEIEDGLICIAVPIIGLNGETIGAISISGPKARIEPNKNEILKAVKETAVEISRNLGRRG